MTLRRSILSAVLVLVVLLSVGCAGRINKVMSYWQDHHYSELLASWGPPQQVYDDGCGGRIFVYTSQQRWTMPGSAVKRTSDRAAGWASYIWWGTATSRTPYTWPRSYEYTEYRMFWINTDGYIYRWSWKGP